MSYAGNLKISDADSHLMELPDFLTRHAPATIRADYYWQDKFYSTTFNRPQDEFDSFDIMNAQIMLTGTDAKWYARAFIQNLEDDDEVTGTYQTDPASGLFTNLFLIELRL